MKKIILCLTMAALTLTGAQAQKKLTLSSNSAILELTQVNTQTTELLVYRYLMPGYNTICLPFDVSAADLKAWVGEGVMLERLAKVDGTTLTFLDVTDEGLKAATPYLIYAPAKKNVAFKTTEIDKLNTAAAYLTIGDVTMFSNYFTTKPSGIYGIPAQQETDILQSILVRTEGDKNFLPTRCGFSIPGEGAPTIKHVTSLNEETAIATLQAQDATVDIYNVGGTLVKKGIKMNAALKTLPRGIYVVNGQKFAVK